MCSSQALLDQVLYLKELVHHLENLDTELLDQVSKLENKIIDISSQGKASKMESINKLQCTINTKKEELRYLVSKQQTLQTEIEKLQLTQQSTCEHWEVTKYNDFDGHNTRRYYVCNTCSKSMDFISSLVKVTDDRWSG
jgi:hypothetical protein